MRYLNKRDEFLKSYSKIVTEREKYVPEKGIDSINEDYATNHGRGPFANDIGWGDSLLGRLINSTIRKAKIGANLLRIKAVESRLRDSMDELLLSSAAADLDDEDKALYAKALITTYLIALEEAVEGGAGLAELKSLTETAISATEKAENLEGKNELLRQLKEWKKYLDQFEEEEAESEEEKGESEEKAVASSTDKYLENFKYLFNMMLVYQGIEKERGELYRGQAADKAGLPNQASKQAPAPQSSASVGTGVGAGQQVTAEGRMLRYEQFINEATGATGSTSIGSAVGKAAGKIWKFITGQKDERVLDADTKSLWAAMKPLYQMFGAEKGTLERDGQMKRMLQNPAAIKGTTEYGKYKSNIDKIYSAVRSANGINEDVHAFLGQSEKIGKMISSIYSITKKHPDGKFMQYPGTKGEIWDDMTEAIAGFNKAMVEVLAAESKWNAGDIATWKSSTTGEKIEKEIVRVEGKKLVFKDKKGEEYTKFMSEVEKANESMILEAEEAEEGKKEEDTSGEVSEWKNPNSITKIQDWWSKKIDLKQWMLDKTEVEKVKVNLEKKLAEKKDSVVIQGMDPILEIVKVFNRAYKLHTTQVIPSGRSGGQVSNKTFLEYHCFGSGSPANAGEGGGPYRNIVVFNQWEDCVHDVMKDKRYQKIFNMGTRLKVGSEYIEKAGANLRKFMSDMLDGEELYRGGSEKGGQAKFLDKYFGYKDDEGGKELYYSESDREAVTSLSGNIKDVVLEAKKSNVALEFKKPEDLLGTFFKLTLKKGNDPSIGYYFYVQAIAGAKLYLSFSNTAFHMQQYIKQQKGTSVMLPNGFRKEKAGDYGPYAIYATSIESGILFGEDGSFNLPKNIEMSFITKEKKSSEEGERAKNDNSLGNNKYSITDAETYVVEDALNIVQEGSEERINASYTSAYRAMQDHGGFKEISSIPEMKNAKIVKS